LVDDARSDAALVDNECDVHSQVVSVVPVSDFGDVVRAVRAMDEAFALEVRGHVWRPAVAIAEVLAGDEMERVLVFAHGTSTPARTRRTTSSAVTLSASASYVMTTRCCRTSSAIAFTSSGSTKPRPLTKAWARAASARKMLARGDPP